MYRCRHTYRGEEYNDIISESLALIKDERLASRPDDFAMWLGDLGNLQTGF
jgi:hypothetical protein